MINENYKTAYQKIKDAKKILLVTHDRPDGDALSSVSILIELLSRLNKNYQAFCLTPPPPPYKFLPHLDKLITNKEMIKFATFDVVIVLDCGSLNRTNLAEEITKRPAGQFIIEFDHHPKIDDYADLEIRIPRATSTAEVLYNFLSINKIKLNKNYANAILTGIMTDTGNLLYDSTSSEAVKIASDMLLYGAQLPIILQRTQRNKSLGAMKLWGLTLSRLEINKKYNFAYSVLSNEDLHSLDATDEELEGIAGFLGSLQGVKGVIFLREEDNNLIKGSLRASSPGIDISKLAIALGGGGHAKASAFRFKGKLVKTKNGWLVK